MSYGPIKTELTNHPDIPGLKRIAEVEIFFLRDEIRLKCEVYYTDASDNRIHSIPPKTFTPSTANSWVHSQTGAPADKDKDGNPVVGSIAQIDYLINIPQQLPNSTTTYGNIVAVVKGLVSSMDARGEFNK